MYKTDTHSFLKTDIFKGIVKTYFIIVVAFVISMRVEYIFTEARPYLINILIPHSMQQEIWVSIGLLIAHFCIEAFPSFLIVKKLIYFPLQVFIERRSI